MTKIIGGPDAEATVESVKGKAKANTVTVTFAEEDKHIYDALVEAAKKDRRSLSQYVLLYLTSRYPAGN